MCYSAIVKHWTDKKSGLPIFVREQVEDYRRASEVDPKRFPPLKERIFPAAYAPVMHMDTQGQLQSELMRYGAYPPHNILNARAYTSFNARRDNLLSPFWSAAFMRHHGFIAMEAFYEWVEVKDLLEAGVVTLTEIKAEFARQAEHRKSKILAAGKKYKPTPTELKQPHLRKIVIEFKPEDQSILLVPVIFSLSKKGEGLAGGIDQGFAIITDEPTPEISRAGHDRCPVILEQTQIFEWLDPAARDAEYFLQLLDRAARRTFRHRLAEAA